MGFSACARAAMATPGVVAKKEQAGVDFMATDQEVATEAMTDSAAAATMH
ncbi:MAG: hypothetical protein U5L03_07420 [Burkholderiaceae bacterium]|nr:hypothetical protein [Burkholderiaceae bacterium]